MKPVRPTLRITILTLFILFLLVSTGTLTWVNFNESSRAALDIADDLLGEVNGKVMMQVDDMFGETFGFVHRASQLPQLAQKPDFMHHDAQWYLAEALLQHPYFYSAYIGYDDGDFFQIISVPLDNDLLRGKLKAPKGTRLAIRKVFARAMDGLRVELWQFLDAERRLIGSKTARGSWFDPRMRPWYSMAQNSQDVTVTPFYVFTSTEELGVTIARRFDGPVPGVFGLDVTLKELCAFFASQQVGENGTVFMFGGDGSLTAYPDPQKTYYLHSYRKGSSMEQATLSGAGVPLLERVYDRLQEEDIKNSMRMNVDGVKYIVRVNRVKEKRLGEQYVAVAAPTRDFTKSMDDTRDFSLYFALGIFLLAVAMAFYFAHLISKPLNLLAGEARRIRHFELDSDLDVRSTIVEIDGLSKAIMTMKSSLVTFGRYVPKTLVRQILHSELSADVGGQRRDICLLFTDIENFTSISETMKPEMLMNRMSDYLETVGSEILSCSGTIDKFIGDAVMAFWNAPVEQPEYAALACRAALRARQANKELNDQWRGRGLPAYRTRFGLHCGNCIVGNVGSADRINYTAIGSAVNLASRLEGLNKYFGTQILVSETVREKVGDAFVFRTAGRVMPKGTSMPVNVYELLGSMECQEDHTCEISQTVLDALDDWEKACSLYWEQRFDEALLIFEACRFSFPEDKLLSIMIEKVRQCHADPPGEEWDGVDIFTSK